MYTHKYVYLASQRGCRRQTEGILYSRAVYINTVIVIIFIICLCLSAPYWFQYCWCTVNNLQSIYAHTTRHVCAAYMYRMHIRGSFQDKTICAWDEFYFVVAHHIAVIGVCVCTPSGF